MTKDTRETMIAKIETAELLIERETDKRELDYHMTELLEDIMDCLTAEEPSERQ